ncbi:hypothetical protein PT974_11172 [Cladobotryum mycophilum]|uniref:Uncharacterized protein n=1 Tax=Cladobotryum mycophilum TaxID=491253 RepID=A0ABR0S4G6_9HYPO
MKLTAYLTLALVSACAVDATSCFCTPKNGCKCSCGHSDLVPDSQWSWHGDGQTGLLGAATCSPAQFQYELEPNDDATGGAIDWRCLYIRC